MPVHRASHSHAHPHSRHAEHAHRGHGHAHGHEHGHEHHAQALVRRGDDDDGPRPITLPPVGQRPGVQGPDGPAPTTPIDPNVPPDATGVRLLSCPPAVERTAADASTVAATRQRVVGAEATTRAQPSACIPAPTLQQVRDGEAKLGRGMQGDAIADVQRALNRDGAQLDPHGRYDAATEQAVRGWQASRGITDSGVVGAQTLRALEAGRPPVARATRPEQTALRAAGAIAMPDTTGMSEAQKHDVYAQIAADHGATLSDRPNERHIVGLRVPTDADARGGQGRYDDRFAMIWKDAAGRKHAREYTGNADPSARYRGRMGDDANGDGRVDQGRLPAGTYTYQTGYSRHLGRVLEPTRDAIVDRDTNHDGVFGNDGGATSSAGRSVLFHAGGASLTGSAGCQTMAPDAFSRFWRDLHSAGKPGTVGYTLVETQ